MKRVKFFSAHNGYTNFDEDDVISRLRNDISDWTELTDEEYKDIAKYKVNIESRLKNKNLMEWNESLLIVSELSEVQNEAVRVEIKSIINDVVSKEKQREEKEKKRLEKLAKTAEQKKKERELKQLKKLQEKYGESNE